MNHKHTAFYGTLGVAIVVSLIGAVVMFGVQKIPVSNPTPIPQGVMCTMEAKQCPDGSYVGRHGSKCEFALCPGEVQGSVQATSSQSSTTLPIQNMAPRKGSIPRPY